jgi:hypothetical protein
MRTYKPKNCKLIEENCRLIKLTRYHCFYVSG